MPIESSGQGRDKKVSKGVEAGDGLGISCASSGASQTLRFSSAELQSTCIMNVSSK